MSKLLDLTGKTFGLLTAISFAGKDERGKSLWLCRCECGTEKVVALRHLSHGSTISCGCRRRDRLTKHGYAGTVLYDAWKNMRSRINNPKYPGYARYGGRGITVCERWDKSFIDFRDDILAEIGDRPSSKHSLDRINNDGNYEPGNVRWATREEQCRNKENSRLIPFNGEMLCPTEVAEITGINRRTLTSRIDDGWSVEEALTAPVGAWNKKSA